jgi:predicted outer membrane repeat protein
MDNIISGNTAQSGGGIHCIDSPTTIIGNVLFDNEAQEAGGIVIKGHAEVEVISNHLFNNKAHRGGGICCYTSSTLMNNLIRDNDAQKDGGGIFCYFGSPLIGNCIFHGNKAERGGGMLGRFCTDLQLVNCTFFNNSADYGGGIHCELSAHMTSANLILWDNFASYGPEIAVMLDGVFIIDHSDVKGGEASLWKSGAMAFWGPDMIDKEPLFVDSSHGDLHLTFPSPCKDAGDPSAVTEPTDFEGDPRIAYGTVDMGGDEFHTHLYCTGNASPGDEVEVKFIGLPGTAPVGLCIGNAVLDPPLPSMWGDWYLEFPIIGPIPCGSIPSPQGVLIVPGRIPHTMPAPGSTPMQALIGNELTNLLVLGIE